MEREEWNRDDALRPLTREGEKQMGKVARALQEMGLEFDLIVSSPYERAKRTAEIVAAKLKLRKQLKFSAELSPEGDPKKLVAGIKAQRPPPQNALLVGHEPYLSKLISLLTCGDGGMAMDFKKACVCKLKVEDLQYGKCAELRWLLTPRQMDLMA